MPLYEHVFLARQDISQAQVDALTKEYSDVITEAGGKIAKVEYWGVKTLAFKIKKNRKAHYSLMNIEAPPTAVAEMERRMGLSPDVIRFLTIRVDAHEAEPPSRCARATATIAVTAIAAAASAVATAAVSAAAAVAVSAAVAAAAFVVAAVVVASAAIERVAIGLRARRATPIRRQRHQGRHSQ